MPKTRKKRPRRRRGQQRPAPPETVLHDAMRAGVDSDVPGPLLGVVGVFLSITRGGGDPATSLDDLVRALSTHGRIETSATLLAIATLTGDTELRRRVRREVADRRQVLPRWLAELDRTAPLDRAVEISTVYRDVDTLLVSATVPGGHPLTAVVLVDNELGAFASGGCAGQSSLDSVLPLLLEDASPGAVVRDISPADARARITAAIQELDLGPGTGEYESWDNSRPLVEWIVSLQPDGGDGEVLLDLSEDELDAIADRFLTSPFGPAWSGHELRPLVDAVVGAGSANGIGDPLVRSPENARKVLDPSLSFLGWSTPCLDRAPELLRDVIRFGHADRGLRPELTTTALAAVDAATDQFRAAVRELDDDEDV